MTHMIHWIQLGPITSLSSNPHRVVLFRMQREDLKREERQFQFVIFFKISDPWAWIVSSAFRFRVLRSEKNY